MITLIAIVLIIMLIYGMLYGLPNQAGRTVNLQNVLVTILLILVILWLAQYMGLLNL